MDDQTRMTLAGHVLITFTRPLPTSSILLGGYHLYYFIHICSMYML